MSGQPKREKVKFCAWLPRDLVEEFRAFVAERYGGEWWGMLSRAVAEALRHWLWLHSGRGPGQGSRTPSGGAPGVVRALEVYKRVLAWITENYKIDFSEVRQVPRTILERGIAAVRGSDPRTVRKWLDTFLHFKFIKLEGALAIVRLPQQILSDASQAPGEPRVQAGGEGEGS